MRKHVKGNVSWVGYIDWELESFHGDDYSIMNGSSQNAYLIEEEKTVLIDTIWRRRVRRFCFHTGAQLNKNLQVANLIHDNRPISKSKTFVYFSWNGRTCCWWA